MSVYNVFSVVKNRLEKYFLSLGGESYNDT